ncbi:hypothetical protein ACJMK2_030915 [Sinanodonta woodiana]|uniref:Microtubule-associated protein Jupiter n=1 Tax=Sinanodonta woodiana TaxID=1069815 RepID=A0ABD3WX79_SINWO
MTTTNTFQGYDGNIKKPTSRVTQPPGGISQVFSGYNEEPEENKNRRTNKSSAPVNAAPQQTPERATAVKQDVNSRSRVFGDAYDPSTDKKRLPQKGNQATTAELYRDVRPKPKKHGAYNPITGEAYDEEEDEKEKGEEENGKQDGSGETVQHDQKQQQQGNFPTRVKQPPGGKSTALW